MGYDGMFGNRHCCHSVGQDLIRLPMNLSTYSINGKSYEDQKAYRQGLNSDGFINAYKPWSKQDDAELIRLNQVMSIDDLSRLFKRRRGAIFSRLKKLNEVDLIDCDQHSCTSTPFLTLILQGIHPLTGEVLPDDSIWKHPAIIEDLENILKISQ